MSQVSSEIEEMITSTMSAISKAKDLASLEKIRIDILGKKGSLNSLFTKIVKVEPKERAKLGAKLNLAKQEISLAFEKKTKGLKPSMDDVSSIDMTKPGIPLANSYGHWHPDSLILNETYQIFTELGFAIVDGPEIETDWYNFEVLNMPPEHPARDMQDTFYIADDKKNEHHLLPRTHTSATQVRFMEENRPPFKIIVPGKVFRNEDEDKTHSWTFYQVEGVVVGENVSLADLKGTLLYVVHRMLGKDADIRLRPSYFPYTEPSVEIDAKMGDNWLELGGAGMVHPEVLKKGGIDPEKYTGFAFGWGVERIAVIKYGISDLRKLWRPNLYFLERF